MTQITRPSQIAAVLRTLSSGDGKALGTELETYIAELEAKQPDRPTRITAILQSIGAWHPADIMTALETYILALEAKQHSAPSDTIQTPLWDPNNPPVWSHQREVERQQRRRERALKKLNNYQ
jgi:hypothetical protein